MKYEIIAIRCEGNETFGKYVWAETFSETVAKDIVDALNKSDLSILYQFGYREMEE